jgi:hypothetical protein
MFINKSTGKISNFWRIPSFYEIMKIEIDYNTFKEENYPNHIKPNEESVGELIHDDSKSLIL